MSEPKDTATKTPPLNKTAASADDPSHDHGHEHSHKTTTTEKIAAAVPETIEKILSGPEKDIEASRAGLRAIATFEATKGALVLFVGLGFSAFLHHDAKHVVESMTKHFRLNPAHHIPAIFLEAVQKASDMNLWLLAFGALAYSMVRFIEAYGLWRQRVWAEWFAIASGGIYLPFEFYELFKHVTAVKIAVTLLNIVIVAYLFWQRFRYAKRH